MIDAPITSTNSSGTGGGGFKKGGFKSSFAAVKGAAPVLKKNVLGDDDDDEAQSTHKDQPESTGSKSARGDDIDAESDTDEEYARDEQGGGYYDPRRPTGCLAGCAGLR